MSPVEKNGSNFSSSSLNNEISNFSFSLNVNDRYSFCVFNQRAWVQLIVYGPAGQYFDWLMFETRRLKVDRFLVASEELSDYWISLAWIQVLVGDFEKDVFMLIEWNLLTERSVIETINFYNENQSRKLHNCLNWFFNSFP